MFFNLKANKTENFQNIYVYVQTVNLMSLKYFTLAKFTKHKKLEIFPKNGG